jgi:hypothetical protein
MDEMGKLGLRSFLPAAIQAPIIVTFHAPKDPATSSRTSTNGSRPRVSSSTPAS